MTFGVIETSTCACTLDAAQAIGEVLQRVRTEFAACEWTVAVEDYLEVFSQRSSAKTLFALAEINALVRDRCLRVFGIKPMSIHPNQARGFFALKKSALAAADGNVAVADPALAHLRPTKAGGALDVKYFVFHYVNRVLALQQQQQQQRASGKTSLLHRRRHCRRASSGRSTGRNDL